ncbi:hypothetical protein ACIQK6_35500 [Streptomyces sp. NPDC091682]|uniref:hypothetical protein n=1 Tax=Streptomyces sp. NPDC091682 TaxID=3366005 RepID=UPI00382FAACB
METAQFAGARIGVRDSKAPTWRSIVSAQYEPGEFLCHRYDGNSRTGAASSKATPQQRRSNQPRRSLFLCAVD